MRGTVQEELQLCLSRFDCLASHQMLPDVYHNPEKSTFKLLIARSCPHSEELR